MVSVWSLASEDNVSRSAGADRSEVKGVPSGGGAPRNVLGDVRTYRQTVDGRALEVVVGLEVHAQLSGGAKVFSGPSPEGWTLDEGLPGSLPALNGEVARLAVALSAATSGSTASNLNFARKSYRSPDIALGYQITQCFGSIASNGTLVTGKRNSLRGNGGRRIRLLRLSVEHDAANFVSNKRFVSYLRAGGSLFELATAPDLDSVGCVKLTLSKLKLFLKALGTSSNVRFDLNLSTAPPLISSKARRELKNLTSLGSLERTFDGVLAAEAARVIWPMTCALNVKAREFVALRPKERAHEYKRIPESNLGCNKMWRNVLSAVVAERAEVIGFGGGSAWTFGGGVWSCEMFTAEGLGRVKIALKVAEVKRNRGV
ncbi:MAG: hypothetical protein ACTS6P_01375 [Candidatus Hodgkinia cicadicola]